jgi:mono/diheme cytochrome c family protein
LKRRLVSSFLAVALATALAAPAFGAGESTDPSLTVFKKNCAACHTLAAAKATGKVGPNLDKLKASRATIVKQVTKGGGAMPPFKGRLKTAQIAALATWISTHYKK